MSVPNETRPHPSRVLTAKLAQASKGDDYALIDVLKRQLTETKLRHRVLDALSASPEITPEQRLSLAMLLLTPSQRLDVQLALMAGSAE